MRCQVYRDAISAGLDGEEPEIASELVDRHLSRCPGCAEFARLASAQHRRLSVRAADAVPDLTGAILARQRPAAGHWSRWALLGVALTQLAIAGPPMVLGHESGASVHLARELGAWDLALGAALLLVVLRPARAQGLVPFAGALAVAMVGAAVVDVLSGRAGLVTESRHVLELAGLALLWVIARRPVDGSPLFDGLRRPRPTLAA